MKKINENQPENGKAYPIMRRGFLKAATLFSLGTITTGAVKSYAATPQGRTRKTALAPF